MNAPALRLYDTVDAYLIACQWIEENEEAIIAAGGELPPELLELLESAEGDMETKVGRTGLVVRNLTASMNAAKEEARRLTALAKSYERQADSLKEYLRWQLARAGVPRIDTPLCKVRRQNNPPTVRPADPDNIPEQYRIIPPPPPPVFDRESALRDVKATGHIPTEPGTPVEVDGLVVEMGEHVRIW